MIYVHIPFCRSFCTYCGFYSELLGRRDGAGAVTAGAFAEALSREFDMREAWQAGSPDTLYIGGGTPSVLPLSVLSSIAVKAAALSGTGTFSEFTVEVNPEDIVEGGHAYVEGLLAAGADRVSMGIQSFDDRVLRWMNRRHDAAQAVEAYRILREAGAGNISVDLIFGLPLMDDMLWQDTLDKALDLPYSMPDHVSAYQLSVEPGSALEKMMLRGRCSEASDEDCLSQYGILCRTLASAGYHHYEVSNFALPGKEAVHNSAYWNGSMYLGFGPGAHSYTVSSGVHTRSWNRPSLKEYVEAMADGMPERVRESETLTGEQLAIERVMLTLRTDSGIPEDELVRICGRAKVDRQLSIGNFARTGTAVRIPEDRFFISDNIIAEIIS